jgi:hypothetical protein
LWFLVLFCSVFCFSILLSTVHLGICHADSDCVEEHHPPGPLHCGCPDCSKPHPPHFQNSYCENLAATSDSDEETSEEAVVSETSDSTSSRGQSSRSTNWLWVAAVGAAVAMVGAAVYAQRKVRTAVFE